MAFIHNLSVFINSNNEQKVVVCRFVFAGKWRDSLCSTTQQGVISNGAWISLSGTSMQGRSQPRRSGGTPASGRWARGWVWTNVSPSAAVVRGSRPPDFLYIFNTKSYVLTHSLAPKMGTTSVLSRPLCIGGNEDCWKRLPNEARTKIEAEGPKIEAEGRKQGRVLGRGTASPTSWGVWQWCKQDQILKTKTKTKITRPRPWPGLPEVNKGTWRRWRI